MPPPTWPICPGDPLTIVVRPPSPPLPASAAPSPPAAAIPLGFVAHPTGLQVIGHQEAVTTEVDHSNLVTEATTVPDEGGTIYAAAVLPPEAPFLAAPPRAQSRKWLPLIAVAGVAVVVIYLAAMLADEGDPTEKDATATVGSEGTRDVTAAVAVPVEPAPDPPEEEAQMAEVTLSTSPLGAEIRVNGVPKGLSPLTLSLEVGTSVWLRLDLDGHEALEQTLEVAADATKQDFSLVALGQDNAKIELAKAKAKSKSTSSKTRVIKPKKVRKQRIRDSADRRH